MELSGGRLKTFSNRLFGSGFVWPFSRREAAILPLISFFVAYTGPFGTFSLGFGRRLAYWSLVVVLSALMANFFARVTQRIVGPGRHLRQDLVLVVLMTIFFTPVLTELTTSFLTVKIASFSDMFVFAQFVAILSLGVATGRRVLPKFVLGLHLGKSPEDVGAQPDTEPAAETELAPEVEADPDVPPQPRLMRRLPSDFTGPILRLTVQDHFVDVIAPEAEHRLRMRFADAVDEMDPVEGVYTHRSHWVARDAIKGDERDGARVLLRLSNGDRVPVSRTYRPELEKSGLL